MRQTKQQKIDEYRINRAYAKNCSGLQIDIMNIGAVFKAGERAIAAGADDVALGVALLDFVNTIRRN